MLTLGNRDGEIDKLKQLGNQDKHQLEKLVRAEESAHAKTKKELKEIKVRAAILYLSARFTNSY